MAKRGTRRNVRKSGPSKPRADQKTAANDKKNGAKVKQTQARITPGASQLRVNPGGRERRDERSYTPPIVALGASAGGLEALKRLFSHMPPDSGLSFVAAMHLDPHHRSAMVDLLSRVTSVIVEEARHGSPLLPNHLYMIPPGMVMTVRRGRLVIKKSEGRHTQPINQLLISLAADQGPRAAAVILSGMGKDGTEGAVAIKHAGGFVVAQSPASAQAASMPESVIAGDDPDQILPPERIPKALIERFSRQGFKSMKLIQSAESDDDLAKVQRELHARTGHDFSTYKRGTVQRRVQRRMDIRRIKSYEEYAIVIRQDPAEATALFRDLLVGVTEFFREPESWKTLADLVLDPLVLNKPADFPLRIWVPGCATGQEAYSIGMLLTERMEHLGRHCDVKIFATDINDAALEIARAGVYTDETVKKLSPDRLQRHFVRAEDGGYQISKQIRHMIVFAQQSLVADPPFSRLDLISCRNVLIYLDPEIQRKVFSLFCHALRPGAFLFLGNTESIGPYEEMLRPLSKKWRIYQRFGPERRAGVAFPLTASPEPHRKPQEIPAPPKEAPAARLASLAQRLVHEHFAPASVLINQDGQVLYFCGPTHDYLVQPPGIPTSDLTNMARPGLRAKLRLAIQRASRDQKPVTMSGITLRQGKNQRTIQIEVTPVKDAGDYTPLLLVVFQDRAGSPRREKRAAPELGMEEDSLVRQLEHDLKTTREDLQSHLEEIETSNEELKAANEEMMSMNEELQSANEELETSKEELQSLNEELTTVNNQLHSKVEELEATNNDLENLLTSTDLATIFLDRDFNIRRFTPAIRQLVSLLPLDVGRPITDFAARVQDRNLLEDARQVLETLVPVQTEVRSEEGLIYMRRILPYRTAEDYIDGVVITFNNISERKTAEKEQAHLAAIVASSEDAIISKNLGGVITSWNAAAERMFGYNAAEAVGKPISIIIPEDRRDEELDIIEKIRQGMSVTHLESLRLSKRGASMPVSLTISPVRDPEGLIIGASTIIRDISERRAAEIRQKLLVQELDHRVRNNLAVISSLAAQTLDRSGSLEEFRPAFEGRIMAMARAHSLLSGAHWKGGSLRKLIEDIVRPVNGDQSSFQIDGEEIVVPPRVAVNLALVFNELATNAVKHGALQGEGQVAVDWHLSKVNGQINLQCSWSESNEEPIRPPRHSGFGSQLILLCIQRDLGGQVELEYQPQGLQCRFAIQWPVDGIPL